MSFRLCVGIDPSLDLLNRWGLPGTAEGALAMGQDLLTLAQKHALSIKPQVAYFEQFGAKGLAALELLLGQARQAGVYAIADAKRTDIGSTSAAYARAWFGENAPLRASALTATAYMGLGAIRPLIDAAVADQGQVIVVVRSSNPEGNALQTTGQPPLWQSLLAEMEELNQDLGGKTLGAVIGATQIPELLEAHRLAPSLDFLCPGLGAQGADPQALSAMPQALKAQMILPISRGLAQAGPHGLEDALAQLRADLT